MAWSKDISNLSSKRGERGELLYRYSEIFKNLKGGNKIEHISVAQESHLKQTSCFQEWATSSPALSSLRTGFPVYSWFPLTHDFGGISSFLSSSVHCGQPLCVSVQIPESQNLVLRQPMGWINCAVRDSVTNTVMKKTGKVPGFTELTVSWLSLVIGHDNLKAAGLWERQLFYKWAVTKHTMKQTPSTLCPQLFLLPLLRLCHYCHYFCFYCWWLFYSKATTLNQRYSKPVSLIVWCPDLRQ